MKYIGEEWLPEPLRRALLDAPNKYREDLAEFLFTAKSHDAQISVTSLTKAPRELLLVKRHWGDIVKKPTDNWYSLLGTIFHTIMEHYSPSHWEKEVRNSAKIKVKGTHVLFHGQFDAYDSESQTLYDWKFVNAMSVMYPQDNYDFQLNAGKYLLEKRGREVKRLVNIYGFRHLDSRMLDNPAYPKSPVMEREVEMWDTDKTREFIFSKLRRFVEALELPDKELPLCTDEERWIRGTQYKVYKRTTPKSKKQIELTDWGKNAVFSSESKAESEQWIRDNPQQQEVKIEEKKGEPTKCKFCDAAPFCNQRQKEIQAMNNW